MSIRAFIAGVGLALAAPAVASATPTYQPEDSGTTFTAIPPCRVFDSRSSSKIANNKTRLFQIAGTTGFVEQGGANGGCGIPASATAVSIQVTVLSTTAAGRISAFPASDAAYEAYVVSFPDGGTATGSITVGLQAQKLGLKSWSATTSVLGEVTGYYAPPLAGFISPSGSLYSGSPRMIAGTRTATGVYEVQFDRSVRYCAAVATVYVSSYFASASTWFDSTRPDTVRLSVWDANGTAADQYVYVAVHC